MRAAIIFLFWATIHYCKANESRVLGGLPAPPNFFLFVVSLHEFGFKFGEPPFCAGSIIASRWILSAAHCFEDRLANSIEVAVRTTDRSSSTKDSRYPVSKIYVHPMFKTSTRVVEHDIALLLLQVPIQYSTSVKPIMLGSLPPENGVRTVAMGWGSTSSELEESSRLMYVVLESMGAEECQRRLDLLDRSFDDEMYICAWGGGWSGEGKTTCYGDSGGPLIDYQAWTQVGIVSSGVDCMTKFPALFTKVETYWPWIKNVTHSLRRTHKENRFFYNNSEKWTTEH